MSSHSRGTSGKPGLKWLVMSSDAGSSVHQHGVKSCGTARVSDSVASRQNVTASRPWVASHATRSIARSLAYELTRRSYAPWEAPQIPDFWDRRAPAADLASPLHARADGRIRTAPGSRSAHS